MCRYGVLAVLQDLSLQSRQALKHVVITDSDQDLA